MRWTAFRGRLVGRVLLLVLTIAFAIWLFEESNYFFTPLLLGGIVVIQVIEIIKFVEQTNREVTKLLNALKHDNFSKELQPETDDPAFNSLFTHIEETYAHFKRHNTRKEGQYQYLHTILQHIGIGVITLRQNEEIHLFNNAAKRLLGTSKGNTLSELGCSPEFVEKVRHLKTGHQGVIKSIIQDEVVEISVYAIELSMNEEIYKLITLQNIHTELSDKEMEAWQKLLRVLTHEIMNSLAPISSLAQTLQGEIEYLKTKEHVLASELEDIELASQTIHRRSTSLSSLINEFRNLSRLPVPIFEPVSVKELFEHVCMLMKKDAEASQIQFLVNYPDTNFLITADRLLIEQVLINLVQNAIHAHQECDKKDKQIVLYTEIDNENRPIIWVSDNGKGIDKEIITKIFVPFYTTKHKGSGIGLSLARQIMQQHKGSINVISEPMQGAKFALRF